MRLIDADLLKKNCKCSGKFEDNFQCVPLSTLSKVIDNQPTAYDADKVVKQLEEIKRMMESNISPDCFREECIEADCTVCLAGKVIEIVKGGGNE